MKLSVIIPTYNRRHDLDTCLDSIQKQTLAPDEIIIVDDSDNNETEQLIQQRWGEFDIRYIHHEGQRSLARCENLGVKHSTGDIVLILDDDVVLEENYIKEILNTYNEHPYALGVQGYITNGYVPSPLKNILRRFLIYSYREKDGCSVLPNGNTSYPYEPDHVISCKWLSGCNNSWKRKVFDEFQFDNNLLGYSFNEDVDFSNRVYKKYPGSLLMTPKARLVHNTVKK
jgi:GT2 family glycosyltransferase